jgi:hypothetical protein
MNVSSPALPSGHAQSSKEFPQNPHWTATEVLTWIAFGRAESWNDLKARDQQFYTTWRSTTGDESLALLEARAAPQPFYPIEITPLAGVELLASTVRYRNPFASQQGPNLVRAIRAEMRRHRGDLITYAELAEMLKRERDELGRRAESLKAANAQVLAAIWDRQVTARGICGESLGGIHREIPREMAMRPIRFRADETEPDPTTPMEDWADARALPVFRQVLFDAAEVLKRWPQSPSTPPGSAADHSRLRKWLEAEMRAAPNSSRSKAAMKVEAKIAGHSFSGAGFTGAWNNAVIDSGAPAWGKAGRKPQTSGSKSTSANRIGD